MSSFRRMMMANAASDPLKVPLTFTADTAGSIIRLGAKGGFELPDCHYRMGKSGIWMPYTLGTNLTLVNAGDCVQFWNNSERIIKSTDERAEFKGSGRISVSGNIMSLMNWRTNVTAYCFYSLFSSCPFLTDASKLELPATSVNYMSYERLFWECTSLTKAPKLPATTLGFRSYWGMFYGCTSLTEAPELPATVLGTSSYEWMFNGCKKLSTIKVYLRSWTNPEGTGSWALNVAPTGTFYKPSALPEEYGTSRIPEGWTVVNID